MATNPIGVECGFGIIHLRQSEAKEALSITRLQGVVSLAIPALN